MLVKQPRKNFLGLRRGLKAFLIFEGVFLVGSYVSYTACNKSQKTRKFLHDHYPLNHFLNFYYTVGEKYGTGHVKRYDELTWEAEKHLRSNMVR